LTGLGALNQTQGLAPLEDVYKDYVWTARPSFLEVVANGVASEPFLVVVK
jgi:hypothetical protein